MIRFGVEWQEAPGVRDQVLARTWCRLVIKADGRLVTGVLDDRSDSRRGGVYGSVFPLAQWIVENWWFLLNESYRFPVFFGSRDLARTPGDRAWIQRHSILAARQGGVLPDLMIYRDGGSVIARWTQDGEDSLHPFLRFTGSGAVRVSPDDAMHGLADLVNLVIERLDGFQEIEVCNLRSEWSAVLGAMGQDRMICEWSARLGVDPHDPDELSDEQAETILSLLSSLDESTRDDLLDAERLQSLREDIRWLMLAHDLAADAGKSRHSRPGLSTVEAKTAHELGYASATVLRGHLRAPDEFIPVGNMEDLLHRLGWAESPCKTSDARPLGPLKAALEKSDDGAPVAVVPKGDACTTRFGLARSIFLGHFGAGTGGPRLVTDAHTWEQRASRAFAAEFLAPAGGLSQKIGERVSQDEVDDLARYYEVSPSIVVHQIQNHRLAWIDA